MICHNISPIDHGRRADSFLINLLPAAPLSYIKKLITSGHFLHNGTAVPPGSLLRVDDTVTLKESSRTLGFCNGTRSPLDILYEDSWIMAVNKPAGLAMHRTSEAEETTLVEIGTRVFAGRGGEGKLRPVNRLDRGTSGVVILAKNAPAAGMFGRYIMEEGLGKLYLAVVAGTPPPKGRITVPLDGKEAETSYRVLVQGPRGAVVALYPLTGRMHQLRQHLSLVGHPILGDRRYGGALLTNQTGHALHSFKTCFTHPDSGAELLIVAPLPREFVDLLEKVTGTSATAVVGDLLNLPLK